ncbi:MAG TPA: universal stress protein [Dehalococcoidia bacterium]|nr:universal stress protein [Dehalococcoidia bacterium]
MYKSVLIALDGSEQAAKAIPQGVEIARQFGATVVLIRAVTPEIEIEAQGTVPDPQRAEFSADVLGRRDYDSRRSQAEGYLEGLKRSLRDSQLSVETRIEDGEPAAVITRVARSLEQPVIVITPYGKSASLTPSPSGVFGRVADKVLKESTAPVLVAKS